MEDDECLVSRCFASSVIMSGEYHVYCPRPLQDLSCKSIVKTYNVFGFCPWHHHVIEPSFMMNNTTQTVAVFVWQQVPGGRFYFLVAFEVVVVGKISPLFGD